MADKSQKNGHPGAAVAVDDPRRVRNIALVGPSTAGKTTLAETLLAASGTVARAGSVTEGTTTCDHDPAAVRQQRSVGMTVAPLLHDEFKINLIDTPGYADFLGEVRAGLRAADAALFVISAGARIDPATSTLWQECAAVGMPRAVVVTRLDHARANVSHTIAACQGEFGSGVLPLYLPAANTDTGLIGLITQRYFDYSDGYPPAVGEPPAGDLHDLTNARNELIEDIIAESEDETLMERYLAGETITEDTLIRDLESAVARAAFHPVIPVCSATGVGIAELLDGIIRAVPAAPERTAPWVTGPEGDEHPQVTADPDGPLVAEVVHTTVDSYVGRVCLARVYSGTVSPEKPIHVVGRALTERGNDTHNNVPHANDTHDNNAAYDNAAHDNNAHNDDERVSHIYSPLGENLREVPYCVAGDICALTKIGSAKTGDTVSTPDDPMVIAPWSMPEPLLPVAVVARTRSSEDTLSRTITRLVAADPVLYLERNADTGQLVLWCMGEAHADVVLSRLRDAGTEVDTEPVRIPLRETFRASARGHGKHVKQSGGHGQYAVCDIEVEPLERGAGFEFVDRVVGGAVPHQYTASVEKGVRAQLERGLLAGHPVVDTRISLVDGKAHSVDSSDAAFQTAGALALKDAAATAGIALLEPVDEIELRVPDSHLGTVLGDLSSRRGRVLGTETDIESTTVVTAEVPADALLRYAIDLRSMTSGTGEFTRRHVRYDPAPENAPVT